MDKKYHIETTNGIVAVRFMENPVGQDICDSLDDAAEIEPGDLRMWDFTCGADLNNDDIQKTADHAKAVHMQPGKVAIVAPQNLTYGVFRMYAAHREEESVKLNVFRTESEAINWLNNSSR